MAQLKSTVVQGNLAVTDNASASCITTDRIVIPDKSGYTGGSVGDASLTFDALTLTGGDILTQYRETGIKYMNTYLLSFPSKDGTIALRTDIPTIDTALSTTSTNPVQNSVITTALGNKLDANNWSTENNKLSYSFNYEEIKIGVNGIYVNSDITQTTANLTWPTQSGKIAITDDIQSYIDTAILGGSW